MKTFLKRFLGFLFFNLAIALVFGSFTGGVTKRLSTTDVVPTVVNLNNQNKTHCINSEEFQASFK